MQYIRTELEGWGGVNPVVTVPESSWEVAVNVVRSNATCNPATVTINQSYSRTQTINVGVSANASAGLKAAGDMLFAELEGTVGVSFTFTGSYSISWDQTFTVIDSMELSECEKVQIIEKINRLSATGTIVYYDHRIICQCLDCGQSVYSFCNVETILGIATGYMERDGIWNSIGGVEGCDCGVE